MALDMGDLGRRGAEPFVMFRWLRMFCFTGEGMELQSTLYVSTKAKLGPYIKTVSRKMFPCYDMIA